MILEFCVAAYTGAFLLVLSNNLFFRGRVFLKHVRFLVSNELIVATTDERTIFVRFPKINHLLTLGTLFVSILLLLVEKFLPKFSLVSYILVWPLIVFWFVWLFWAENNYWHLPFITISFTCSEEDYKQYIDRNTTNVDLDKLEIAKILTTIISTKRRTVAILATCLLTAIIFAALHTENIVFIVSAVAMFVIIVYSIWNDGIK
jgi:hypothetical protein